MLPKKIRQIQTLVFLDFETTGLDKPVKATELTMLAIDRVNYEEAMKKFNRKNPQLPRVQNKLTICFNPGRSIHPRASQLTGLNKENTKNQHPFDASLIKAFLGRFPKPLCLIAHNGNSFDFPIFVSETRQLVQVWEDDVFCADSMAALKQLEYHAYSETEAIENHPPAVNLPIAAQPSSKPLPPDVITFTINLPSTSRSAKVIPALPSESLVTSGYVYQLGPLPTLLPLPFTGGTPELSPPKLVGDAKLIPVLLSDNAVVPDSNIILVKNMPTSGVPLPTSSCSYIAGEGSVTETRTRTVMREDGFFETVIEEETAMEQVEPVGTKKLGRKPKAETVQRPAKIQKAFGSVKLPVIYERLFGKAPGGSHGAEDDVISMTMCCLAVKQPFLQWVDENAKLLSDVKGRW